MSKLTDWRAERHRQQCDHDKNTLRVHKEFGYKSIELEVKGEIMKAWRDGWLYGSIETEDKLCDTSLSSALPRS